MPYRLDFAPRGPRSLPIAIGAVALVCATLSLGCPSAPAEDDGGSSTGTAGSTGTTAVGSTGGPGSTGASGSGSGSTGAVDSGSSSAGPTDTTAGSGSSTGGTTVGSEGSDSGSTTEGVMPCPSGCAVEFACGTMWESEEACIAACEANLVKAEGFSIFCRMAWENLSLCLGTLVCEEYEQWLDPAMIPYPCFAADQGLEIECAGQ